MKPASSSPSVRVVVLSLVLGIAALGDLRAQHAAAPLDSAATSRVLPTNSVRHLGDGRAAHLQKTSGAPLRVGVKRPGPARQRIDDDTHPDNAHPDDAHPDDARVVPALYATDPSVRFVYFGHISRWM